MKVMTHEAGGEAGGGGGEAGGGGGKGGGGGGEAGGGGGAKPELILISTPVMPLYKTLMIHFIHNNLRTFIACLISMYYGCDICSVIKIHMVSEVTTGHSRFIYPDKKVKIN